MSQRPRPRSPWVFRLPQEGVPTPRMTVARVLRGLPLGLVLAGAGLAPVADAADAARAVDAAAATKAYAIPAGSLGAALSEFASEAGVTVQIDSRLVADLSTAGASGDFSVADGFAALLRGTNLEAVEKSAGVFLVRARAPGAAGAGGAAAGSPASVLSTVKVSADDESGAEQEARRLNPPTTVGSKIPLTQREIPQTVSVVTAQQIEQQKLVDLNEAVVQTPGLTAVPYNAGQVDFYSRGFPVDVIQLDGIPFNVNTSANGLTNFNLAMYDHIEVLDGPTGLMSGFGGAGGALDLVRKLPQKDFSLDGDVSIGTYADRRESLDVTGSLNKEGAVRGRFIESAQDTHLQEDGSFKKQALLYGIVESDLTPSTLLTIGGSYQRINEHTMDNGYPAWSDYQLLTRPSQYIGSPADREKFTTTTLFGSVEQKLGEVWMAKFTAQAFNTSSSNRVAYPYGLGIDVDTGNTEVASFANRESNVQHAFDLFAAGPVRLFGRVHQLTVGMDYQTYHFGLHDNFDFSGDQSYNYCNPVLPPVVPGNTLQTSFTDTSQFNVYANARISIADPLTLVIGGALSWWRVRNTYAADENAFGAAPSDDHLSAKATPFVGLIYDIGRNLSAYASYTSIFEPQSETDKSGNLISPLNGKQAELGVKGAYLSGKMNASASVFQITQENRAVPDPSDPLSGYDVASGKARSRGFQLSATGEVLPDWTVFGGYTYTDVVSLDSTQSATGTSGQPFTAIAPKNLFRLWTNYRFHDELNKLNVGGGINVSSRYFVKYPDYQLSQGGYMTVNLQAGYDITKNISAQLNISNLFNRSYYQALGGVGNGNFLGDPREVLLTFRFRM